MARNLQSIARKRQRSSHDEISELEEILDSNSPKLPQPLSLKTALGADKRRVKGSFH